MEQIVIADTDVLIDFFAGVEPAASSVAQLIEGERLALTSVTVFELYAGIIGKRRLKQIGNLVSLVRVFSIEPQDSETAAKVFEVVAVLAFFLNLYPDATAGLMDDIGGRRHLSRERRHDRAPARARPPLRRPDRAAHPR